MCPISVEPWAECGPSWDLGPRAPVCSWEGPDMMLRLSQHWDHLSNRQADRPVSTLLESAILGEHRCCSVTESCPTLCDPVDGSTPGFPVLHHLRSLLKLMSTESVMSSNHLILCHMLVLLPSIFPSIRVSFPISQFFASGGQSIGASASTSVLPMNIQG